MSSQNSKIVKIRKYSQIKTEQRLKLLDDILVKGLSIKQAAQQNGIKFSSAKVFLKLYRNEGRVGKLDEEKLIKFQEGTIKNDQNSSNDENETVCRDLQEQIENCRARNNYLQFLLNNYLIMNYNIIQK